MPGMVSVDVRTRTAADVRPVAVAVLELLLWLRLADGLVARVLLLGEAEVDEGLMPAVPKAHRAEVRHVPAAEEEPLAHEAGDVGNAWSCFST